MSDVFLCGDLASKWQDEVKDARPDFEYYDPRLQASGLSSTQYVNDDLDAIRACRFVFAYLETNSTEGLAIAMMIGYAIALGKPVILVVDPSWVKLSRQLVFKSAVAMQNFALALDWFTNDFTGFTYDRGWVALAETG